jgi:serine/threonine protein kinase
MMQPGQIVAKRYLLHRQVHAGPHSELWEADLVSGRFRKRALLKLPAEGVLDARANAEFLRKAEALADLGHPHLIEYYDCGTHRGRPWVAMEYVDGWDLRRVLSQGPRLPVPIAAYIGEGILGGLHALHESANRNAYRMGILHRGIAPENILLSRAGLVKLCDFGLIKVRSQADVRTGAGIIKGVPGYVAPERYEIGHATRVADLFSAGVVLWEMLAGHALFGGATDDERREATLRGSIPALPRDRGDLPAGLESVVGRLLARNPGHRPPDAATALTWLHAAARVARPFELHLFLQGMPDSPPKPNTLPNTLPPAMGPPTMIWPDGLPRHAPPRSPAQPMPPWAQPTRIWPDGIPIDPDRLFLQIDLACWRVFCDGAAIPTTGPGLHLHPLEMYALAAMGLRPGRLFTSQELCVAIKALDYPDPYAVAPDLSDVRTRIVNVFRKHAGLPGATVEKIVEIVPKHGMRLNTRVQVVPRAKIA